MNMPKLTHKGWFLLCPVYLADINTDGPYVEERRFIPVWWFSFSACLVDVFLSIAVQMGYEPLYPILITGELNPGGDA